MTFSTARALEQILEATAGCTGDDFFRALAKSTTVVFGTRYGYVGELIPGSNRARALAFWDGERFAPPMEYELEGTPCSVAISGNTCLFPSGVRRLFPTDAMLTDLNIEAYCGVPLRDVHGRRRGVLAALHDAPLKGVDHFEPVLGIFGMRACVELDRRDTAQALQASERRYRQMVTVCNDGVWVIDPEGLTTFVNDQMAAMVGCAPDEMLGRSVFDFVDARSREHTSHNMERRKRGVAERHESRLKRKDGSVLDVMMSTSALTDDSGAYAGALAMVTDLTELRVLEARVRDAERLESLGLLAGGVAHDFNNLLVGVLGRVDLALLQTPDEASVKPLLAGIREAAERAADLTRQLLAYAGKASFASEPIDVNHAVLEIARLSASAIARTITLEVAPARASLVIEADRSALTQVLLNLITNAAQAIGERPGTVHLTTALETIEAGTLVGERDRPLAAGKYVVLRVRDDGPGMNDVTMARIFEPFFSTKGLGRGLGLAAVQGIVRSHGGAVSVDSEPGRGTTFSVHLPASDREPQAEAAQPERPLSEIQRQVILVADDEDSVREVAKLTLEAMNYTVELCNDGSAAVERVRQNPNRFALALLDVTMPYLGGVEASDAIRALQPDLPIVFMSGYNEQSVNPIERSTFLQKPFRITALREVLERMLTP